MFPTKVAAVAGLNFQPVNRDPRTSQTWEKGRILVSFRPVPRESTPSAADSAAAPGPPERGDSGEPPEALSALFGAKQAGTSSASEQATGVFGFTLVYKHDHVEKALSAEIKSRDKQRKAAEAGLKPRDLDEGDAPQPLCGGIPLPETSAEQFGVIRQARFLTSFTKSRNSFAHGDDSKRVQWRAADSAERFAARLAGRIKELQEVKGHVMTGEAEGQGSDDASPPPAGASASAAPASASSAAVTTPGPKSWCVRRNSTDRWGEHGLADAREALSAENIASLLEWAHYAVQVLYPSSETD